MIKKILLTIGALLLLLVAGTTIYINDFYRAEDSALLCIAEPAETVSVTMSDDMIVFAPQSVEAGVIFYPGGKVEAESYAPLMEALAERGILSIIVPMPGNLAVLDVHAAEGIMEQFKDVPKWYMAGHSLGGSMAASYISEHVEEFEGLIMLASYSTEDLSKTSLDVISLYGENDEVLNMEKYTENIKNFPKGFEEVEIAGGCHAYFGAYGEQEGDGTAIITQAEQIKITADAIEKFVAR